MINTNLILIFISIIVFIFVVFFYFKNFKKIKSISKIIFPFLLIIIFLLIFTPILFFNDFYKKQKEEKVLNSFKNITTNYDLILKEQSTSLINNALLIENDDSLILSLKEKDKEKLFNDYYDTFLKLKENNEITHLYFFDENRNCILRVHNKDKYGDFIDRFTAKEAERTKNISYGLEIGPLGTFTLRVVNPILEEGEIIGYIEIGKEIEDILNTINNEKNTNIVLLLNKNNLKKESWENGMQLLGRDYDWDYLEDKVLIYNSFLDSKDIIKIILNENKNSFTYKNQDLIFEKIPLKDVSSEDVGEMFLIYNITEENNLFKNIILLELFLGFILFLILIIFFFIFLKKIDKEINKKENEIRESLGKYKSLIFNIPGATYRCLFDKNWTMEYISNHIEKITGYSCLDFIDNKKISYANIIHPIDKIFVQKEITNKLKNKDFWEIQYRIITKNKEIRWVLEKGCGSYNKDSNLEFLDGIIIDITEQKRNEIDLLESKNDLEKYKLAVENASDQIVITDIEGIVLYANKAMEKITGFSREEALGKKAGILWSTPMSKEYYENLWRTIKIDKKVFKSEIKNKRKNGEYYIADISISPILDKNDEVIYFVALEHDITKEKEIDKAKSEFVSLASHQLRTPLSSINWYTEMLLDNSAGEINEDQRKYLNEVAVANKRMVELVDSLLNVSRLDLGTFIIEPKLLNILEISKSVIEELKVKILEKKLKIEENYFKDNIEFNADYKLLRIIFQNLLSNAVKYTKDEGEIKINISEISEGVFKDLEIKEDSIVIEIKDNGMGIPESQKEKIFSKMFRADNAKESETEGTGLGLYIIKSIVDKSGGIIFFESKEGEGTVFFVIFPKTGMQKKEGEKTLD